MNCIISYSVKDIFYYKYKVYNIIKTYLFILLIKL